MDVKLVSVTLREEYRLRMIQNRVGSKIFGDADVENHIMRNFVISNFHQINYY
jgi:hypothetical protein